MSQMWLTEGGERGFEYIMESPMFVSRAAMLKELSCCLCITFPGYWYSFQATHHWFRCNGHPFCAKAVSDQAGLAQNGYSQNIWLLKKWLCPDTVEHLKNWDFHCSNVIKSKHQWEQEAVGHHGEDSSSCVKTSKYWWTNVIFILFFCGGAVLGFRTWGFTCARQVLYCVHEPCL